MGFIETYFQKEIFIDEDEHKKSIPFGLRVFSGLIDRVVKIEGVYHCFLRWGFSSSRSGAKGPHVVSDPILKNIKAELLHAHVCFCDSCMKECLRVVDINNLTSIGKQYREKALSNLRAHDGVAL